MGCDIRTYLEVKRIVNGETNWISADLYKKNCYDDPNSSYDDEYNIVNIYDGRDYELFSILADVRNYHNNQPIDEARGIPDDCCKEIKQEYERWRS